MVLSWFLARGFSEVMASFAYRESHRRYYRDPELIPSTAQGYKVVQKPNRALNAIYLEYECSVTGQYILRFFPYTFQLLKRGGVQCKTYIRMCSPPIVYACKEISACAFFGSKTKG